VKLSKNRVDCVLRGGCFGALRLLSVTYRVRYEPVDRGGYLGFRFVIRRQK
jgi:hypothetical protein